LQAFPAFYQILSLILRQQHFPRHNQKDEEVQWIIHRIEGLEVDRKLGILKIQARYGRLEGCWNLEYKLRTRIMEILANEAYAAR